MSLQVYIWEVHSLGGWFSAEGWALSKSVQKKPPSPQCRSWQQTAWCIIAGDVYSSDAAPASLCPTPVSLSRQNSLWGLRFASSLGLVTRAVWRLWRNSWQSVVTYNYEKLVGCVSKLPWHIPKIRHKKHLEDKHWPFSVEKSVKLDWEQVFLLSSPWLGWRIFALLGLCSLAPCNYEVRQNLYACFWLWRNHYN